MAKREPYICNMQGKHPYCSEVVGHYQSGDPKTCNEHAWEKVGKSLYCLEHGPGGFRDKAGLK